MSDIQCGCLCHSTGLPLHKLFNVGKKCCGCLSFPRMENSPETTLILCPHQIPIKFPCERCWKDDITIALQCEGNARKSLHELITHHYLEINERIEKLEQHKNYQIDENRKISRRVDEFEKSIEILCDAISNMCETIERKLNAKEKI